MCSWQPADGDSRLRGALADHDTAGSQANLEAVADALGDTLLMVALAGAVDHGPPATQRQVEAALRRPVLLDADGGGVLLPVFTHLGALRCWRQRARFVSVPGGRLSGLAAEHGVAAVAIDPAGPHPAVLAVDLEPSVALPVTRDPRFGLSTLSAPLPEGAVAALRAAVDDEPTLAAAWAVELIDPAGAGHLVIAFDPAGDAHAAARRVADRLRPRLTAPEHELLDIVVLDDPDLRAAVTALDDPVHPAPQRPAAFTLRRPRQR